MTSHLSLVLPHLLALVAAPREPSTARQFLLVDQTVTYKDSWNAHSPDWIEEPFDGFFMQFKGDEFAERRSPEIPDSWIAPVDYRTGTLHVRVEVLEKPNQQVKTGIILRMTTEKHSGRHTIWYCHQSCKFDKPGVYHFREPVAEGARFYGPNFEFAKPVYELQLIVSDAARGIVHKKWEGGFSGHPDLSLYLPLKARVSAFVVAKGAKFRAPDWW